MDVECNLAQASGLCGRQASELIPEPPSPQPNCAGSAKEELCRDLAFPCRRRFVADYLLWGVSLVDPLLKWDRDNAPGVFADIERVGLFVQRHGRRRCETIGDHGRRTGWIIEAQD